MRLKEFKREFLYKFIRYDLLMIPISKLYDVRLYTIK